MPHWKTFSELERRAVYDAIFERRDIRSYRRDPVPWETLARVLEAAHRAPSVGFMQPWNLLVVEDIAVRSRIHGHFLEVNERAAKVHEGERGATYRSLKLQGIVDAPINIAITCDSERGGPNVLGRFTTPQTDVYSTCLAIQNLWLAARAEGLGVGWMSIMEPDVVKDVLGIPDRVQLIAYMTLGFPVAFPDKALLESVGWRKRMPVGDVVYHDRWGQPADPLRTAQTAHPQPAMAAADAHLNAQRRMDTLTKPAGSLGRLEHLGLRLCELQQCEHPRVEHRWLLLMAGDHGVVQEGVSAYRPDVTAKMVYQFVSGGGAVNAFARQAGLRVKVVDMGVAHDFGDAAGVVDSKVARGTRNLASEAAMSGPQLDAAIASGRQAVDDLEELQLLAVGEMGIGNTTAASAMVCALLDLPPERCVGKGTGVGPRTMAHKCDVVRRALELHRGREPREVLRCMGGFEIAGLVGAMMAAVERRVMVVLDGFITAAAALVAVRLDPRVRRCLVAGHRSAEPGHGHVLESLELSPLLELDMRLGEGSGAALAVGLVDNACRVLNEMSTFQEAGIAHPTDDAARR